MYRLLLNCCDAVTINKNQASVPLIRMYRVMSQYRYFSMNSQPRSFSGQIFAFVGGLAVLAASFVLGAFLLAAFFGFVMVVGLVVTVRLWWLKREAADAYREDSVLDAEYTVAESPDYAESIEHRPN